VPSTSRIGAPKLRQSLLKPKVGKEIPFQKHRKRGNKDAGCAGTDVKESPWVPLTGCPGKQANPLRSAMGTEAHQKSSSKTFFVQAYRQNQQPTPRIRQSSFRSPQKTQFQRMRRSRDGRGRQEPSINHRGHLWFLQQKKKIDPMGPKRKDKVNDGKGKTAPCKTGNKGQMVIQL